MTRTITQLVDAAASAKAEKNSGRKAAVLVNSAVALVLALRRAATQSRQVAETMGNVQVSGPLAELLKVNWNTLAVGILLTPSRPFLLMEICS